MEITKFRFYKEDSRWFVDIPEWEGSQDELEMVCGADAMLDYMAEGNDYVFAYLSDKEFANADSINLIGEAEDIGSGAYYLFPIFKGVIIDLTMWLCDVTKFLFEGFPEKIFILPVN